ncbi:MAG: hypothetical protein ACWA44_08750 [Thiotrichales bacterium]
MAYTIRRAGALARKRVSQRLAKTAWMERNGRRFIRHHVGIDDGSSVQLPAARAILLENFENLDPQGC